MKPFHNWWFMTLFYPHYTYFTGDRTHILQLGL